MSVLIKGMDTPKACRDCSFMAGGWCRVWSDDETRLTDTNLLIEKPDWCPLVEVETIDQEELITPLNMIGGYLRRVNHD